MQRGIFGGTFDPIHIAHLAAAETAYRVLGLDVVTFIPAGDPWQKADRVITPGDHRQAMVERAIDAVEYFECDPRELERSGPSYTIDTVAEFEGDDVTLVLGADAAAGIATWHRADELLDLVQLAVVPRPGAPKVEVDVTWLPMPELDISATRLRSMAASGASIRFLVPEAVYAYIGEHRLYG